jgi:hypothetical protein
MTTEHKPLLQINELTVTVIVAPTVTVSTDLNTHRRQPSQTSSPNPARPMFKLNFTPEQLKKIAKGFGLAMAGAAVSFGISTVVPEIQASGPMGLAIAAIVSSTLNAALKAIQNAQQT